MVLEDVEEEAVRQLPHIADSVAVVDLGVDFVFEFQSPQWDMMVLVDLTVPDDDIIGVVVALVKPGLVVETIPVVLVLCWQ